MSGNFGDFQMGVYADAVSGVNSRYLFDFRSIEYGGTESLTHYMKSFLTELDLTLSICGFKDIATLKAFGCEPALTAGR